MPAPPFHYEVPAALLTAPPVTWRLETKRGLGEFPLENGFSFSRDGRFVASGGDNHDIVVRDLHSDKRRRITGLPLPVRYVEFSPDGQRLFVVMESDPREVGVADLKTGDFIPLPQPRRHAVPEGAMAWWTDTSVLFVPKTGTPLALDLDTLEFDPVTLSGADLERFQRLISPGFPLTDQWAFKKTDMPVFTELPEVEGTAEWGWRGEPRLTLVDLKRASLRVFIEIGLQPADRVFGTADGSKVLRFRDGGATAFYFSAGPVPPAGWKITFPHGPGKLRPPDAAREAAETGRLSLLLYRPLINPLNKRTVGPDRERPKGILRITKWEGNTAEVWMESGIYPWEKGDVFADVFVPGDPPVLLAFDQPHRWWTAAPEPEPGSDDPARLPPRTEPARARPAFSPSLALPEAGTLSPSPPAAAVRSSLPERDRELMAFVLRHHKAASDADLEQVLNDYAESVVHFENGTVNKAYIRRDETDYHSKLKFVRESVVGLPVFRTLSEGRVEATYQMASEWERKDGVRGSNQFRITLELNRESGGWRIVRHVSGKIK